MRWHHHPGDHTHDTLSALEIYGCMYAFYGYMIRKKRNEGLIFWGEFGSYWSKQGQLKQEGMGCVPRHLWIIKKQNASVNEFLILSLWLWDIFKSYLD